MDVSFKCFHIQNQANVMIPNNISRETLLYVDLIFMWFLRLCQNRKGTRRLLIWGAGVCHSSQVISTKCFLLSSERLLKFLFPINNSF